jgi:hypothetical protein
MSVSVTEVRKGTPAQFTTASIRGRAESAAAT